MEKVRYDGSLMRVMRTEAFAAIYTRVGRFVQETARKTDDYVESPAAEVFLLETGSGGCKTLRDGLFY